MGSLTSKDLYKLKQIGPLKELNYSTDMSDTQRKQILFEIVSQGKMNVKDIENHIQMLINLHINDYDYKQSVRVWKKDLKYVKTLYDGGAVQQSLFE